MTAKFRSFCVAGVIAWLGGFCLAWSVTAATLSISPTGPTLGVADAYNFSGTARDGGNVGNGYSFVDGAANDAFTYVAGDRADQGQTFTTGTNGNGYFMTGIWLRHAGYTNNTALTYWQMNSGVTITVRVTDPTQAGGTAFALDTETYVTTGNEGWAGNFNSNNGDGDWVHILFDSPVTLAPGRTYGFDVTSSTTGAFFEWLGTSNSVYSGGTAYNGSTTGQPDDALNPLVGSVFL